MLFAGLYQSYTFGTFHDAFCRTASSAMEAMWVEMSRAALWDGARRFELLYNSIFLILILSCCLLWFHLAIYVYDSILLLIIPSRNWWFYLAINISILLLIEILLLMVLPCYNYDVNASFPFRFRAHMKIKLSWPETEWWKFSLWNIFFQKDLDSLPKGTN